VAYPPIETILPHSGSIILLQRVVSHSDEMTECEASADSSCVLADSNGFVPGYVSLEYMAQTIGAHAGLVAKARGEEVRVGFVLGSRRLNLNISQFPQGKILIRVKKLWMDEKMGMFDCEILSEEAGVLAQGALNVYQPSQSELSSARPS